MSNPPLVNPLRSTDLAALNTALQGLNAAQDLCARLGRCGTDTGDMANHIDVIRARIVAVKREFFPGEP